MMIPRILIRHLTGSKAHRVDQFALVDVDELTVGRAPASNVSFDGQAEDTVSRRHALIRVVRRDRPSFTITDLGSSNGLRVNGRPVNAEQNLGADDLVELGPDGPSFKFAIEPGSLLSVDTRDEPTILTSVTPPAPRVQAEAPDSPRPARRVGWVAPVCVLLLLVAGVGAMVGPGLIRLGRSRLADGGHAAGPGVPPAAPVRLASAAPPSPAPHPVAATAAAMVYVEARWRLYDKDTGQPVYQKTVLRRGQRLPCFVQTIGGRVVPWLTTEDEDHTNSPIGGVIRGSGFIVGSEGSIITSRHLAAGWTVRYFQPHIRQAALFRERTEAGSDKSFRTVDPDSWGTDSPLAGWVPGQGGMLFRSRAPIAVGTAGANLEGRNDSLNVLLPSSHASTPARLVLASDKADIAELRIDVGDPLPAIPLADAAAAQPGQAVTAFFYPAPLAAGLDQPAPTNDAPDVPRLASAKGSIVATHDADGGGLYELSMDPGAAADGGPVVGADGAALGVVTSDPAGDGHVLAYPARAARALLESQ